MNRMQALEALEAACESGLTVEADRTEWELVVRPASNLSDGLADRLREAKDELIALLDPAPPEEPCDCGGWVFVRPAVGEWSCLRCGDLRPERIAVTRYAYPLAEDADEVQGAGG